MGLPNAEELAAILAVARAHGVSRLRVGGLEVQFAPMTPALPSSLGADLVAAVSRSAPLPDDPIETIKDMAGPAGNRREMRDPLEILSSGGKLMVDATDPTQAS